MDTKRRDSEEDDKSEPNGIVHFTARAHSALEDLEQAIVTLREKMRPVLLSRDCDEDRAGKTLDSADAPAVEEICRLIRRIRWQTDAVCALTEDAQI